MKIFLKRYSMFLATGWAPVFLALVCFSGWLRAEVSVTDRKMTREVFSRLVGASPKPADLLWPPALEIVESDHINALAGIRKSRSGWQAVVFCHGGLLKKVVEGNPDRLAYVLGHELAHHILGHTRQPEASTGFLNAAFNREQELQADLRGMELALQAGFSYRKGLSAIRRLIELGDDNSSFEMLSADHPAWVDRIALLDHDQADLWRATSAFDNGVYFLMLQNYAMAERTFRQVTREFPAAYDAWVNLGYAQLMQYADALDAGDLRRLGISQLAVSGFYVRNRTLSQKLRGVNEALWADATVSLQEALKQKPDLAMACADLGLAYLLKPSGEGAGQAVQWLEKALALAPIQPAPITDFAWLSSAVNLAAADAALGNDEKASAVLGRAGGILEQPDVMSLPEVAPIASALHYNRAMLLARSPDESQRRKALAEFESYLRQASPSLSWWSLAWEHYSRLCGRMGTQPKPQTAFGAVRAPFRPVTGIEIDHLRIDLGTSMAEAKRRLGRAASVVAVAPGTSMMQYGDPERGVRVMGMQEVLAITLTGANAPTLPLQEAALGGRRVELRAGMALEQLDAAMAGAVYDIRPLVDPQVKYRFYPDAGLAVRIRQGKVSELVIGQVPRPRK